MNCVWFWYLGDLILKSIFWKTWNSDFKNAPHTYTHTHKLETWNRFYSFIYLGDSVWLLLLFSHSVVFDSLRPHELQHTRLPCPSPSPGVCSNSCPLSQWCHPIISSSVTSFSSCPQSFPASGSFPMSLLFASGGQCTGGSASTSVLPMNIQGWFPLGLTGLILLSKGLSRVFSSTTARISSLKWRKGWMTSQAILKSLRPCSRDSSKSSNSSHIRKTTWKESDEEVLEHHSSRHF